MRKESPHNGPFIKRSISKKKNNTSPGTNVSLLPTPLHLLHPVTQGRSPAAQRFVSFFRNRANKKFIRIRRLCAAKRFVRKKDTAYTVSWSDKFKRTSYGCAARRFSIRSFQPRKNRRSISGTDAPNAAGVTDAAFSARYNASTAGRFPSCIKPAASLAT